MPFISNSKEDIKQMLARIGVDSVENLLSNIPKSVRLNKDLDLSEPMSEYEVFNHLASLAEKNASGVSFVGGGAYDHYTPAIVDAVISRSEFMTAYTPYQAEVSQGTLQAIYEFQTHIARLTGMDVANASMYDGATALAEAIVATVNPAKRNKVIIPGGLNPAYLTVAKTYLSNYDVEWIELSATDGWVNPLELKEKLSDDIAAVILQQPNYFGIIEQASAIGEILESHSAKFIVVADPNSLGILEAPGNYGADIVVGEGQSLGLPLNFGGPYVGFFAANKEMVRRIPGRIVGVSEDAKGRKGYILTLQTREQHIRREKATSNICTNSGLMALAVTVYLSWIGKEGLPELGNRILQKSHYLADKISALKGFEIIFNKPFYKEFVVSTPLPAKDIIAAGLKKGFKPGIDVSSSVSRPAIMLAVTEQRSKDEMDHFVEFLSDVSQNR